MKNDELSCYIHDSRDIIFKRIFAVNTGYDIAYVYAIHVRLVTLLHQKSASELIDFIQTGPCNNIARALVPHERGTAGCGTRCIGV